MHYENRSCFRIFVFFRIPYDATLPHPKISNPEFRQLLQWRTYKINKKIFDSNNLDAEVQDSDSREFKKQSARTWRHVVLYQPDCTEAYQKAIILIFCYLVTM
jgi:hypothetical protein